MPIFSTIYCKFTNAILSEDDTTEKLLLFKMKFIVILAYWLL